LGLGLGFCLLAGFQTLGAGPAAVATLPSALLAREEAPAPIQVAAALPAMPLTRDADLFASILDEAFPAPRPVEPRATGSITVEDPN
jgi:hypothetical protein